MPWTPEEEIHEARLKAQRDERAAQRWSERQRSDGYAKGYAEVLSLNYEKLRIISEINRRQYALNQPLTSVIDLIIFTLEKLREQLSQIN